MRDYVRSSIAAIYPAILFGPNRARREEARELLKAIVQKTGDLTSKERVLCWASIPFSIWTWLTTRLDLLQQPRLLRIEHRHPAYLTQLST